MNKGEVELGKRPNKKQRKEIRRERQACDGASVHVLGRELKRRGNGKDLLQTTGYEKSLYM